MTGLSMEQIEQADRLTDEERTELAALEARIEQGVRSFVEVGRALQRVQETRLYRETHATFEDYVAARFDLKRQRAYELIDAARVHDLVSEKSDSAPARESHAAALAPLRSEPEVLTQVWESATSTAAAAERPVTAADIREARRQLEPEPVVAPVAAAPAPPESDGSDLRFAHIEEGVQILRMLPAADRIVWPADEGDLEAIGEAVEWLAKFAPQLKRAWGEHKRSHRRLHAV